jgi:hypothetical protein
MASAKRAKFWFGKLAMRCGIAFVFSSSSVISAPPVNDNFANAIAMPSSPTFVTGTTVGATRQVGEPTRVKWDSNVPPYSDLGTNSVWWKWTSPSNSVVKFATGTEQDTTLVDTQLGVYTGTLGNLTEIGSNEDSVLLGHGGSAVIVPAMQGITYYILVAGYESDSGPVKLHRFEAKKPTLTISSDGEYIDINVAGEPTASYRLQSSENMVTWLDGVELKIPWYSSSVYYFAPMVPQNRFYRVVQL